MGAGTRGDGSMRTRDQTIALLLGGLLFTSGCGKQSNAIDTNWTQPNAVAGSIEGLMGWVDLHKFQDTLIGVNVFRDGSAQLLILNRAKVSWSALPVVGVPSGYLWAYAAVDSQSGRILLPEGYVENEQLVMKVLMGTLRENVGLQNVTETKWITDKTTLLGKTGPNVKLNYLEKGPQGVGLGPGILNGLEAYIPYCLDAAEVTHRGNSLIVDGGKGLFSSGISHSVDSGKTWQLEKVCDLDGAGPAICRTTRYLYYFGGIFPWWFSRRPMAGGQWERPQEITKTFARAFGRCDVAGEGDTAHVCWMDRRHDKLRFNPTGPRIENCDIYYRRRKDSDSEWSKEAHLSKGLLYCYAPTIAAEGNNVVVVWAGIKTADKQHTDMGPNDI